MRADITSIIDQAKRLQGEFGKRFQYQVLLSDLYGANAGEPANTQWPCANGDCSNYVNFLDSSIEALKASGINFAFDIWNEPEFSFFWGPGVNTPQYFEMWDTAFHEIRRLDPGATIVGPSFAFTPLSRPQEWQAWFQHVTATNTVPDMISNHDEGDVDDPVAVGNAIEADAASAGLGHAADCRRTSTSRPTGRPRESPRGISTGSPSPAIRTRCAATGTAARSPTRPSS